MLGGKCDSAIAVKFGKQVGNFSCAVAKRLGGHFRWAPEVVLATSELRKRPGKSEVDNASWDCFRGRAFCLRPLQQSHDALSTSLLPGLLRNSEVANRLDKWLIAVSIVHFSKVHSIFSSFKVYEWESWGSWSPCSVKCAKGIKTRKRRCLKTRFDSFGILYLCSIM